MSCRLAFSAAALTGALLCISEPASAARGMRAMPGGFMRAPQTIHRQFRAPMLRPAPHGVHGLPHSPRSAHGGIPPSPHGYATTTPPRPFAHLQRRHHGTYHSGWYFPTTIAGDGGYGYIGMPYDPAEAFPVYGPAPLPQENDPSAVPAPAVAVRLQQPAAENRDACRSEQVTVPAVEGERAITVVRC